MVSKYEPKLTIKKAADILGVTPLTLRNWDKQGKLKAFRGKNNNYRLYTIEQIRSFLERGAKGKVELRWGYDESIKCREEENERALFSVDAVISPEATNIDDESDRHLHELNREALRRGVKFRLVMDLSNKMLRERAKSHSKRRIITKDRKIRGVTFSVRDKKVTRIEIPTDDAKERLNVIIYDKKVARVFSRLFNNLWKDERAYSKFDFNI